MSAPFKTHPETPARHHEIHGSHGKHGDLEATQILPARATALDAGATVVQHKTFEIVELMAEGGMGEVYRAYDPSMDRYIALKVLKSEVPESERMRFHREAVLAANFSHPNLVRVLEIGQTQGTQWMAMEHLRGRDLGQLLTRGKPIAFRLLLDIFIQTLEALHYIHQRSIVHCDIKPENIFITRDGYDRRLVIAKLIDFGIARTLNGHNPTSRYIMGDPRYMSPEQSVLDGKIDTRSDLYSLGLTFFEALTLRHAFEGAFEMPIEDLLQHQREIDPPPPSTVMDQAAPQLLMQSLDRFVAKACSKHPARRFQDAISMRKALETMQELLEAEQSR